MSEVHLRGISTTLAFLDESLCNFERWAQGHEARGVLYEEWNTLSPRDRQLVLSEIKQMRRALAELRDELHLKPNVENVASAIWSWCWCLLEAIEELDAKHLRRYGEPPPELVARLSPRLARLCDHLKRIREVANPARALPRTQHEPKRKGPEHTRGQEQGNDTEEG